MERRLPGGLRPADSRVRMVLRLPRDIRRARRAPDPQRVRPPRRSSPSFGSAPEEWASSSTSPRWARTAVSPTTLPAPGCRSSRPATWRCVSTLARQPREAVDQDAQAVLRRLRLAVRPSRHPLGRPGRGPPATRSDLRELGRDGDAEVEGPPRPSGGPSFLPEPRRARGGHRRGDRNNPACRGGQGRTDGCRRLLRVPRATAEPGRGVASPAGACARGSSTAATLPRSEPAWKSCPGAESPTSSGEGERIPPE